MHMDADCDLATLSKKIDWTVIDAVANGMLFDPRALMSCLQSVFVPRMSSGADSQPVFCIAMLGFNDQRQLCMITQKEEVVSTYEHYGRVRKEKGTGRKDGPIVYTLIPRFSAIPLTDHHPAPAISPGMP